LSTTVSPGFYEQFWDLIKWPVSMMLFGPPIVSYLKYDVPFEELLSFMLVPKAMQTWAFYMVPILVGSVLGALLVKKFFKVHYNETGLKGRNSVGKSIHVNWQDIVSIKPSKTCKLLVIKSREHKWAIFVPLKLEETAVAYVGKNT